MKILRTLSACPYCNSTKEVWFNKGIAVLPDYSCYSCGKVYDSTSFITTILEHNSNNSFSVTSN